MTLINSSIHCGDVVAQACGEFTFNKKIKNKGKHRKKYSHLSGEYRNIQESKKKKENKGNTGN